MVERFEITHDNDIGVIHRPHPNGYYVRWSDYEALRADLYEQVKRERDEFRDIAARKSNQVAGLIKAEAAERLAGARVKVKALGDWRRGYCDDEVTIEQVTTGFGSIYQVCIFEGTIWLDHPVREKEAFPTVEAAKSAAQADYERRILSALAEPAGEAEPYETPIAAEDGREVDWVDVTGWGVFKGHAIPVDVARYIATKINLYAQHRTTPPDASAIREALERMLKEHDILSGNFGDVMDPKYARPDRWPTAAQKARAALAGAKP